MAIPGCSQPACEVTLPKNVGVATYSHIIVMGGFDYLFPALRDRIQKRWVDHVNLFTYILVPSPAALGASSGGLPACLLMRSSIAVARSS